MTCTKEELQERIRGVVVASNGHAQYPAELRREVIEYSKPLMAQGQSQQSIADELGMNGWTLNRWHQNESKASVGGASFIEVPPKKRRRAARASAAALAPAPGFEVSCPSGFEVLVPANFEAGAFAKLVQVLEGR